MIMNDQVIYGFKLIKTTYLNRNPSIHHKALIQDGLGINIILKWYGDTFVTSMESVCGSVICNVGTLQIQLILMLNRKTQHW